MTEAGLFMIGYVFVVLFFCLFPFTISAPYHSLKTIFRCKCEHKRKHHIMKITGYHSIFGITCYKYCKVCNHFCIKYGLTKLPAQDLRLKHLPHFQETAYEAEHVISKSLSRKLHIR